MATLDTTAFVTALQELLREAYLQPGEAGYTWFADEGPEAGFITAIESLTPQEASRKAYPEADTVAAHCNHLAYHLSLANRSFHGENAFAEADWPASWELQEVNEAGWRHLREQLAVELDRCLGILGRLDNLDDPMVLRGAMALLAHGAWHLGAVKQLIPMVKGG